MRSLRLLILLLSGLLVARCCRAGEAITLPLRLYSFPELARALSTDGRTIACPPRFAQRVALIRLQDRDWEATRRLLQKGLGLQIRASEAKPGDWQMEADPALEVRYDRWRMKLAQLVVDAARENVQDYAGIAKLSYDEVIRTYLRADAHRQAQDQLDPDHETEAAQAVAMLADTAESATFLPVYLGARKAMNLRPSDVFAAMKEPQRLLPIDVRSLRDSSAVRALIDYKIAQARKDQAADAPENAPVYEGLIRKLLEAGSAPWSVSSRLEFDPQGSTINNQIVVQMGSHVYDAAGFYGDPVEGRWLELIPKLGKEGAKWLDQERAGTERLLRSPSGTANVRGEAELTSLSLWVEAWGKKNSTDVVMELAPGRESVAATEGDVVFGDSPPAPSPTPGSLASAFLNTQSGVLWSVEETDGAWLFTDRLAFLDRLRERPTAALIALEHKLAGASHQPAELTLPRLSAFHQAVTPEQSAALGPLISYRGLDLTTLATCRPAIQILASLTATEQEKIAAAVVDRKTYDVPLSRLPTSTANAVAASLRALALSPHGYSVPDTALCDNAVRLLSRLALHLRSGEDRDRPSVIAALILANPTAEDVATDHLEVDLPGLFPLQQ